MKKLTYETAKSKNMTINECIAYVFDNQNKNSHIWIKHFIPYRAGDFDKWIEKLYKLKEL